MSDIKALDKLREVVRCGEAHGFSSSKAYYDTLGGCIAEIEREVSELQESWAQEAREHASDSARLAELAHENAELKREISERFVELPVDMDGAPIHEGNVIQFVNEQGGTGAKVEVCAISKHYAYYGEGKHFYRASMCRHVKPRTLEDVLKELANEVWEASCTCQTTWSDSGLDGIEERYAAEIRELMGVSE